LSIATTEHDALAEAICKIFEETIIVSPPKPLAQNPYIELLGNIATQRAAVACAILSRSHIPDHIEIAKLFHELSLDSPIANATWSELEFLLPKTNDTLQYYRKQAIEYFRYVPRITELNRIQKLIEMGDLEFAKCLIDTSDSLSLFEKLLTTNKLLTASGLQIEADYLAEQMYQDFPLESAKAGISISYVFRSLTNKTIVEPKDEMLNPDTAKNYLNYLNLTGKKEQALLFATNNIKLARDNSKFAYACLPILLTRQNANREIRKKIVAAAQFLPVGTRLSFNHYYGFGDELKLIHYVREYANFKSHAYGAGPLIEKALLEAPEPFNVGERINKRNKYGHIYKRLLEIDYRHICGHMGPLKNFVHEIKNCQTYPQTNFLSVYNKSDFDVSEDLGFSIAKRGMTDRAKSFLAQCTVEKHGTILYSIHTDSMELGSFQPSAIASDFNLDVLSIIGHSWPTSIIHQSNLEKQFSEKSKTFKIFNTQNDTSGSDTKLFVDHLNNGGILHLTNDGLSGLGLKAIVPWIMRPYELKSYTTQLCLTTNSKIGFAIIWRNKTNDIQFDISPISVPPEHGSLRTRSTWLTQRVARNIRKTIKDHEIPLEISQIVQAGGAHQRTDLLEIDKWLNQPNSSVGLLKWLFRNEFDKFSALEDSKDVLSFQALREYVLRAVSMILHFQSNKIQHFDNNRRFLDQHRVLLILPKGSALLASALGTMVAGSLLAICQNDLAPNNIVKRILDFKPDLIISSASIWSEVCKSDKSLIKKPVLVCCDNGDSTSLEDLLESFQASKLLPKLNSEAPSLAVYTSGSEGQPKAVILPTKVLSENSGIDFCANLKQKDKFVYLTRWDAVGVLDIFAALRAGATFCVPEDELVLSSTAFITWIKTQEINFLSAPVTIWKYITQSKNIKNEWPESLTKGLLWGERIFKKLVLDIETIAPNTQLFCIYGTTEFTYISFGKLNSDLLSDSNGSPGGQALFPDQTYLINQTSPMKFTNNGESNLIIRGPNAMIGYWSYLSENNGFVISNESNWITILDNVRISDNYSLEILGRSDSIIKIAGRRISLNEIEIAAETVDNVIRAIAFSITEDEKIKIYVAVETESKHLTELKSKINQAIKSQIGSYARPNKVVYFNQFPSLASGKLDRKNLELKTLDKSTPKQDANLQAKLFTLSQIENEFTKVLVEWAISCGLLDVGEFQPNLIVPDFSSIEILEIMLLTEEKTGHLPNQNVFEKIKGQTWESLANLLSTN